MKEERKRIRNPSTTSLKSGNPKSHFMSSSTEKVQNSANLWIKILWLIMKWCRLNCNELPHGFYIKFNGEKKIRRRKKRRNLLHWMNNFFWHVIKQHLKPSAKSGKLAALTFSEQPMWLTVCQQRVSDQIRYIKTILCSRISR